MKFNIFEYSWIFILKVALWEYVDGTEFFCHGTQKDKMYWDKYIESKPRPQKLVRIIKFST